MDEAFHLKTFGITVIVVMMFAVTGLAEEDGQATFSRGEKAVDGVIVHNVRSAMQSGPTEIRVLMPEDFRDDECFPVVYLLPVEANRETRYGDALAEIIKHKLNVEHRVIFVAPTFSSLPWYADHPSDRSIQQEAYFLNVVVPFIDQNYPVITKPEGRLLLGFSKSGWGAWSLLLRHPATFGRAAAWDAPLMMSEMKYGSAQIFGTLENFERYRLPELLRKQAETLHGDSPRLIVTGVGNFQSEHERVHVFLVDRNIPHVYRDAPQREHTWHSGWVSESLDLLLSSDR